MVEINMLGLGLGVTLTLIAVAMHFSKGTGWSPTQDISQEVLEQRAASVPKTEFPEPMNRSIGGGAPAAAGAVAAGETGELEEGSAEGDAGDEEAGPWDISDEDAEYFEVEYVNQGETISVPENKTILESGEDQGWDLPYACRQGQCVSCAGRITDGGNSEDYVVHDDQQMLEGAELGDGYTLTCVAYPKADFSIETGEAP